MKLITAYHFLQESMTAGSGDEKAWEIGEKRSIAEPSRVALCKYGYHSSPTLWDALNYAPGPIACLVKISKPIATDDTKAVSATRTLIKAVNIDRELRVFACDCAERVLHIFERERPNDKRPREAIAVARRFADGKATKKELDAARVAARDAAGDAARAAAGAAAWAAAWAAARAAARDAAGDAARAAAGAAARAAAWAAARAAARDAAGDAARAAAGAAERKWQRDHFNEMFDGIFK